MAAFVMAIEEINNRSDLLPHEPVVRRQGQQMQPGICARWCTRAHRRGVRWCWRLGARGCSLRQRLNLGSRCASLYSVPQISPSRRAPPSPTVSCTRTLRVAPSDAHQSFALADLVSTSSVCARRRPPDGYGTTGMAAFINEARLRRIGRLAVTSFASSATDFAPQIDVLRNERARRRALLPVDQAADFIAAVQAAAGSKARGSARRRRPPPSAPTWSTCSPP